MTRMRFFSRHVPLELAFLALLETIIVFASYSVVVHLGFAGGAEAIEYMGLLHIRAALFAFTIFVGMYSVGLYRSRQRLRPLGIVVRVHVAVLFGILGNAAIYYFVPSLITDRGAFALASITALIGLLMTRAVFLLVIERNILKRRILVLGAGDRAGHIARLSQTDQRGYQIFGYVPFDEEISCTESSSTTVHPDLIWEFCRENRIDEIVVAMDDRRDHLPTANLLDCRLNGIAVLDATTFLERETGRIDTQLLRPDWLIYGEGFRNGFVHSVAKRAIDLSLSILLLILISPIFIAVMIAIFIEDRGRAPILYRQRRVGRNMHHFEILKFRSMRIDAEADGKPVWSRLEDSRVTAIGKAIRRLHIDELPQLINIIRGDMSFVGPRPERAEFVDKLSKDIAYYNIRHCVKPGLTGWAQLCFPYGSSRSDATQKLQYDLYYVKNHSLIFDYAILMQTIEIVVMGGAISMPERRNEQSAGV